MYIQVTVDLNNYTEKQINLRLSDQYTATKFVDIVWEVEGLTATCREGRWIRVKNKSQVIGGDQVLADHGVTNGDHLVIL
ncbi:EsaB/YukD family protein [Shouchella lonarensis]|uniref:Uncharacterized ubiquitin-like protein YukD n=1 Tax=Shouchella lonarensis TaxID=1464122 RepID=A0A1G6HNL0_9BACI|nr:EsaB/YukD family protein [Shouchella lonarensis]SDB95811.1 Uncharacterized ubiquitin-like protein YukD [Shouchella lonarensis]